MSDLISREKVDKKLIGLWNLAWGYDIPSPTVPEYVEFHEAITAIMKAIKEVRKELEELPSAEPEIIRCKDCKHKPHISDEYDYDNDDCGFEIIFPDFRCPCRCEDEYYNRIPDNDWYCGNAERRTDG